MALWHAALGSQLVHVAPMENIPATARSAQIWKHAGRATVGGTRQVFV